jgi:hypothetical protein
MTKVIYEPVPLPPRINAGAGRPPAAAVVAMMNCPVGMSFFWAEETAPRRAARYIRSATNRIKGSKFKYRVVTEDGVLGVRFLREA